MAKEEKKAKKRPTAEKRILQNKKSRLHNRIVRSQIKTTIKKLEAALENADATALQEQLSDVYSVLDKGVKKGILKKNKAARTKSRLAAKAAVAKA
ncbi:MAG: 30S ribosomal protein S20 [Chlamydiales bacterium]